MRVYAVDADGQQSYLASRSFDGHAAEFNGQKPEMFSLLGAQSLGDAALDEVYGVLGTDLLGQFKSYTFDYRTMRFAVTAE